MSKPARSRLPSILHYTPNRLDSVLNYDRLDDEAPKWRELELNYRLPQADSEPIFTLFVLSLLPVLCSFLAASIGTAAFLLLTYSPLIVLIVSVIVYLRTRGDLRQTRNWALAVLLAPPAVLALALASLYYPTAWLVVIAATIVVLWLLDRMMMGYAGWILADYKLDASHRIMIKQCLDARFSPAKLAGLWSQAKSKAGPGTRPLPLDVLKELQAYRRRMLFIVLLYAGLVLVPWYPINSLLAGFLPPLIALFVLLVIRRSFRRSLFTFLDSVNDWQTYGNATSEAPGVYRHRYGSLTRRGAWTLATVLLVSFTILPAVNFLPFVSLITNYGDSFEDVGASLLVNADDPLIAQRDGAFMEKLSIADPELYEQSFTLPGMDEEQRQEWNRAAIQALEKEDMLSWSDIIAFAPGALSSGLVGFSIVGCFFFPLTFFLVLGLMTTAPVLVKLSDAVSPQTPPENPDTETTEWASRVATLAVSKTALESEHLWLGAHLVERFPILLHRDLLAEHAYLVGDTGSGKTALGVSPLVTQLIRAKARNEGETGAIVILDLKGDASMFHAAREEAQAAGLTFKYFTNELGRSTHVFNPFLQVGATETLSLNQLCELILEALNLNHGEGYGRSYYSRVARRWLSNVLRTRPDLQSFREIYELDQRDPFLASEKERQDAFELISVIESLASFDCLNLTPTGEQSPPVQNAIHMDQAIQERQVIYFRLPASIESATVREVAKLAIYALVSSSYLLSRDSAAPPRSYLVIDEFQRIASENFRIVLEQARSFGIGAILANQTFADLKTPDADLRSTIQSNTRIKLTFSSSDLDQQDQLMKASGETLYWSTSFSENDRGSQRITLTETVSPRINRNHIIQISDHPLWAVAHVARGSGYSQFSGFSLPVLMGHAITRQEYDRRLSLDWPDASEETIVNRQFPLQPDGFGTVENRLAKEDALDKTASGEPVDPEVKSKWVLQLNRLRDHLQHDEGS